MQFDMKNAKCISAFLKTIVVNISDFKSDLHVKVGPIVQKFRTIRSIETLRLIEIWYIL